MASQRWDEDEALLADLGEALRGPSNVPERLVVAAKSAFTWRTIDEDLAFASTAYDSWVDTSPQLTRAPDGPRELIFSSGALSVHVEVNGPMLLGQFVPPDAGAVELIGKDGPLAAVDTDELGCFTLERPDLGRIRLRCRSADVELLTDWFQL